MALKIKLKQRWLFKSEESSYAVVAEVIRHPAGSFVADLLVRQVIGTDSHYGVGNIMYDRSLTNSADWTYLIGQDRSSGKK